MCRTSIPGTFRSPRLCLCSTATKATGRRPNPWRCKTVIICKPALVDLRAEIEEAVRDFSTAYQNARSVAQEQLKLAAEVRDSITKAYDAGGRPLIDVLDAERSYRDTYRLYISSRANYWRSVYKYNSAIGKQVTQ